MMTTLKRIAVCAFWLLVWQLASLLVSNPILLCGPLDVVVALAEKIGTSSFWASIGFSLLRISAGFIGALLGGLLLGALAWRISAFATLFNPAVQFVKSVPIVCFIVLLLLWFGSFYVSAVAVFLVAFPAFYFATIEGLQARDERILHLLQVFRVPPLRRAAAFMWPTMLPFLTATSRVAVGMSWKAGVAAELIGLPLGSIGENIYQAKISLSSADLLAWTLVIVFISLACEHLFLWLLQKSERWSWQQALPRYRKSSDNPPLTAKAPSKRPEKVESPSSELLRLTKVTKSFSGKKVIELENLVIRKGEVIGLNDPSGSGKTTLLHMLASLTEPDSGSISPKPLEVSMVFQESRLFEKRNAIDNIRLVAGRYLSEADITSLLIQVLPPDSLQKPVAQLSGGMRRRVEIVRALAMPSSMILMDEPFAGLDEASAQVTRAFISEHLGDRTLVIASHHERDFAFSSLEHRQRMLSFSTLKA